MKLLDELPYEYLDEEQQELADCLGMEAYKRLVAAYGGLQINVRKPERITMGFRDSIIRSEFNGYNYAELALKYGLGKNQIRNIVSRGKKR
ncbi:Mor transcription activator family protein [Huintestinicola sp.]